ncbi:C-type mannose receptor 2 [Liparis tanakae]|uniref:C-type mannose receptor 2 n=1 Tax=Liparis tanakae TaxID=230148 RepID=A0A4Z2J7E0_9TELE|nr:C-type mannose receptor 2 [Liparis tanakae]
MDNGSWKWSDGLAFAYQNFGRYYYNVRQCAAADLGTMTWLAMHCSVEQEPDISEGTTSPEWIGFQEADYKFFDHRTTWDQAQRICSWFDSSLASMVKAEGDNWWLGLHTYENDGRFRWSDHSVLNYVSWALGRPHPVSRDRRCVHMLASKAIVTTLLRNASVDLWVGLTSDSKGHFQWAKAGLLSYTNWAPGEPLDNSGPHHDKNPANCVVMIHGNPQQNTGMWASRACEMESNGFICQRSQESGLPAAPALIPASLSKPVELGGVTYRVVEKRLDWTGALHLCESLNGTLATVKDPYQQAYLTLLVNSLRRPAWIGIYNYGGRSFTWLGEDEVSYSNWKDGEPHQTAGCGHMTTTGQWTTTPCDAKLEAAICQISEEPVLHEWLYPGQCSHSVGEWSWVPFRNHCYAFNLQSLRLQQDARSSCKKVGAELLSILDETENGFVWEHIQSYAEQAHGAWLGISVKVDTNHLPILVILMVTGLVLVALIVGVIYLYRRRTVGSRGSYEGARYSRTNSSQAEQVEKNILVSDMELNEQAE